jgi:hypothetical protein
VQALYNDEITTARVCRYLFVTDAAHDGRDKMEACQFPAVVIVA